MLPRWCLKVLMSAKSPLITAEDTSLSGQPVLPSRSPSAAKAEAAKQMLMQQSRQMPCTPALGPEATAGDRVLQVRPLMRRCLPSSEHSSRLCTCIDCQDNLLRLWPEVCMLRST